MPGSVSGFGDVVDLNVTATDVSASGGTSQTLCVFQLSSSFRLKEGDICAQAYAFSRGTTGSDSKTVTLLPYSAPSGTRAMVAITLSQGDGASVYYTYQAGTSGAGPETVPTPSAFGQTVTAPEPPPGGGALINSPDLAAFGTATAPVTVDVGGMTVKDLVIAAARHQCFYDFAKVVISNVQAGKLLGRANVILSRQASLLDVATGNLIVCLSLADALEASLNSSADAAKASCAESVLAVLTRGTGRTTRTRSIKLTTRPSLRVRCSRTHGGVKISISTLSPHISLRSVVGSRLRLALARSPTDPAGGQLSVTFGNGQRPSWTGNWSSNFGAMHLNQSGSHVTGTYTVSCGPGTITGTVKGSALDGTWAQKCNSQSGRIHFVMSPDGASFKGAWSYGSAQPTAPWNGTRT